jgi:hypothetical protein
LGLLCDVVLCLTLKNKVDKSIWGHIFKDLVFLGCGSIQLPETEHCTAVHCKYYSSVAAFRRLHIVWLATMYVA